LEVTLPDYLLKLEAALWQMLQKRIQLPASDESSPQSLLHNSHSRFPLKYILSSPNLHLAYDSYILQGSLHKHHNILHRNYTAHTDSLPDVLLPDDGLPQNGCVNELPVVLLVHDGGHVRIHTHLRDHGDDDAHGRGAHVRIRTLLRDHGDDAHGRGAHVRIRTLLHTHDDDDAHGRGAHVRIRTLLHAHDGDDAHGRGGHGHIRTLLHAHDGDDDARVPRGHDHGRDGHGHIHTLLHVHDGDARVPRGHDHGRGGHGHIHTLLHVHDGDDHVPRGHDHGRGGHGHIHTLLHVHGDVAHDCEFLLLYVCCGFSQQLLHLVP